MRLCPVVVSLAALSFSAGMPAAAQPPTSSLSSDRLGQGLPVDCSGAPDAVVALNCWLRDPDNPVADAMYYRDSAYSGTWRSWPQGVREELNKHFSDMVEWYHDGMPATYPMPFPTPIPKLGPDDPTYKFWMSEALGRTVYLSQVANSLAAELTGAFAWSIKSYTPSELSLLLSYNDYMFYGSNAVNPGYFFRYNGPSSAVPGYVVGFFKDNGLIAGDAAATVGRLFAWERQLRHDWLVPGSSDDRYAFFWGPDAPPIPVSAIIDGTTVDDAGLLDPFGHYTAGCSGTMQFMKAVLRAVNIPVERHWVSCQHATPIFPTIGLALTHGDDPYDRLGWVTPQPPPLGTPDDLDYFVTLAEFDQLFPPGQDWDACAARVGIQVANVAIDFGSDLLMDRYCQDLAAGASHESGQVYQTMQWFYSLLELEGTGLWTTLDTKVSATDWCAQP